VTRDWPALLRGAADHVAPDIGQGKVADYIPALAKVAPDQFAIAVTLADGAQYSAGQADTGFSIQSISKVFGLTIALDRIGDTLFKRVGREPSGSAFNSIVQLERENGIPRNPFINAGALVVADHLVSCFGPKTARTVTEFARAVSGNPTVAVDEEVARSERAWGDRNLSLLHFMRAHRVIDNPVDRVLDAYVRQCALNMTVRDLSRAGLYLAFGGRDPVSGRTFVSADRAHRILALMLTCGHYDMSGEFAYHVGLPGKSGVGGGILAIAPGIASIAVWSPALNRAGNSHAGTLALKHLSQAGSLRVL